MIIKVGKYGLKSSDKATVYMYHKVPKFSDARKLCRNLPKIQTEAKP